MLTLVQDGDSAPRRRPPKKPDARAQTLRAMHVTWRKVCPLDGEELRDARLAFATKALGLKKPLKSTSKLSQPQLGRILDAMRELEREPTLPGVEGVSTALSARPNRLPEGEGEVVHLATKPQVEAIDKLLAHLGWSPDGVARFMQRNFRDRDRALLTPKEASTCTYILLRIAAHKRIKDRGFQWAISNPLINREMRELKRELGIDQKPTTTDYAQGDFDGE